MKNILDFIFGNPRQVNDKTLSPDHLSRVLQIKWEDMPQPMRPIVMNDMKKVKQALDKFDNDKITAQNVKEVLEAILPVFSSMALAIEDMISKDEIVSGRLNPQNHRDIIYAYIFGIIKYTKGFYYTFNERTNNSVDVLYEFLRNVIAYPKTDLDSFLRNSPDNIFQLLEKKSRDDTKLGNVFNQIKNPQRNPKRRILSSCEDLIAASKKIPSIYRELEKKKFWHKITKHSKYEEQATRLISSMEKLDTDNFTSKLHADKKLLLIQSCLEDECRAILDKMGFGIHQNKRLELSEEAIRELNDHPDDHHYLRMLLLLIKNSGGEIITPSNQEIKTPAKYSKEYDELLPKDESLSASKKLLNRLKEMKEAYIKLEGKRITSHGKHINNLIKFAEQKILTDPENYNAIYNLLVNEIERLAHKVPGNFTKNLGGHEQQKGKILIDFAQFLQKPEEMGKHHYARMLWLIVQEQPHVKNAEITNMHGVERAAKLITPSTDKNCKDTYNNFIRNTSSVEKEEEHHLSIKANDI